MQGGGERMIEYSKAIQDIPAGEAVLLFERFPIEDVPKMKPFRIEKLTDTEITMYEKKIFPTISWDDWDGVNKFIVSGLGGWYLVRIYES